MKKHTILKVRCAWHKKNFGFVLEMGTKEGHGVEGTTDGMCPACEAIERKKLKGVKTMSDKFNQDPEVEQARAKLKEDFLPPAAVDFLDEIKLLNPAVAVKIYTPPDRLFEEEGT